MHRASEGDATGAGDNLDTSRNIHPIAHQVVAMDHDVANMNADSQRQLTLAVSLLGRPSAVHRLNRACELDKGAVAHRLEEPASVLGDLRFDHVGPQRLKLGQRACLVLPTSFE